MVEIIAKHTLANNIISALNPFTSLDFNGKLIYGGCEYRMDVSGLERE